MRVIAPAHERAPARTFDNASTRTGKIELLGVLACSLVLVFGLSLTYAAKTGRSTESGGQPPATVNLQRLGGPEDLVPLLTMFEEGRERQLVAQALYRRALEAPPLDHVGGLASVTIPAADIRRDPRLITLRARLTDRPGTDHVPALTPSDIAALKPQLVIRTREQYAADVRAAAAWFFVAFWIAHLVRRWRRADDDPLVLPVLLLPK